MLTVHGTVVEDTNRRETQWKRWKKRKQQRDETRHHSDALKTFRDSTKECNAADSKENLEVNYELSGFVQGECRFFFHQRVFLSPCPVKQLLRSQMMAGRSAAPSSSHTCRRNPFTLIRLPGLFSNDSHRNTHTNCSYQNPKTNV